LARMLRLAAAVLLCGCGCATPRPATAVARTQTCQQAYDDCSNACFDSPNYKRGGPQCTQTSTFQICPPDNQPVDTVAAAKCFEQCEWNVKLCQ